MDHGELLWEALWLTIHSPRGDHEVLWAPCWKSSMTSGIQLRASLLCMRQLQLCSSGPWQGFGDILVGDKTGQQCPAIPKEKVFPLPPGSTSTDV